MIGLATDSNAQLPPELVARYRVEVVPLTVTVDGEAFLEGVDLDADRFYERLEAGAATVSTSQPSPGHFDLAYRGLTERGATEILSVHIGSAISGTVNAARLAAAGAVVPVRVVDTGQASFGVACCLWEAAEAVAGGASLEEAALVAEGVGARVGTVFVVGALDLARAGGRLADDPRPRPLGGPPGIPVLTMVGGKMRTIGSARDPEEAAEVMAAFVMAAGPQLRVGVGVADRAAEPLARALEKRLSGAGEVREVVRYRIGPSVGAHTGPGTAGAYFYPSAP